MWKVWIEWNWKLKIEWIAVGEKEKEKERAEQHTKTEHNTTQRGSSTCVLYHEMEQTMELGKEPLSDNILLIIN